VTGTCAVRPVRPDDLEQWLPLWEGYNAFYGRAGESALPTEITRLTWQRFLDPQVPVFALVAEEAGRLAGLAHYLHHHSTTRAEQTCYLQDLFTASARRGQGIGRALILGVYEQARRAGIRRVYWQTQEGNTPGRRLYDKLGTHFGFIVYSHEL